MKGGAPGINGGIAGIGGIFIFITGGIDMFMFGDSTRCGDGTEFIDSFPGNPSRFLHF